MSKLIEAHLLSRLTSTPHVPPKTATTGSHFLSISGRVDILVFEG